MNTKSSIRKLKNEILRYGVPKELLRSFGKKVDRRGHGNGYRLAITRLMTAKRISREES